MVTKTKHIWMTIWFLVNGWMTIHIDEFSISWNSIKQYSWVSRGEQDYWMIGKREMKLNWILAVGEVGPICLHVQEKPITSGTFCTFLREVIQNIINSDHMNYKKTVLMFDNARIHVGNGVKSIFKKNNMLAITLPPYTPEFSEAEIAINIIKRGIDRKLRRKRQAP